MNKAYLEHRYKAYLGYRMLLHFKTFLIQKTLIVELVESQP